MTVIRTIIGGPSKWDIILSLCEDKPVTFTLQDGEVISMIIENVHDFRGGDYIQQSGEFVESHPDDDGWLIAGRPSDSLAHRDGRIYQIWIEYDAKPRAGIAVVQSEKEYTDMSEILFLPFVWHEAMGVDPFENSHA